MTTGEPRDDDQDGISDHAGHRARLRRRFLTAGAEALADYELLELLLFTAKPRGDVKPLAKRLIKRFGTFAEVISAPEDSLNQIDGMGTASVAALKTAKAAAVRLLGEPLLNRSVLAGWRQVIEYCRVQIAHEAIEELRILFLDTRNRLIRDERQGRGTIDHTPLYVREVCRRALDLGASAIIVVHNHPSGDPKPSKGDIEMTHHLRDAALPLKIVLHDHIVVGRQGHYSFKENQLI
jgi:DNA repair protein RadC